MSSFTSTLDFEVVTAGCCNVPFAMNAEHYQQRQRDRKSWWCPNCGACRVFTGEAPEQRKLREAEQRANREAAKAARAENRAKAVNRQYKRIRDRVKNGVCPCCNRTFGNLANHMRTQHKDFGKHDLLKALRTAYGLTQTALAEEIWVNPVYVSLYENNKALPEDAAHRIECWLLEQTA